MSVEPGGVDAKPVKVVFCQFVFEDFSAGVAVVAGERAAAGNNKKLPVFVRQLFSDKKIELPQKQNINLAVRHNQRTAEGDDCFFSIHMALLYFSIFFPEVKPDFCPARFEL